LRSTTVRARSLEMIVGVVHYDLRRANRPERSPRWDGTSIGFRLLREVACRAFPGSSCGVRGVSEAPRLDARSARSEVGTQMHMAVPIMREALDSQPGSANETGRRTRTCPTFACRGKASFAEAHPKAGLRVHRSYRETRPNLARHHARIKGEVSLALPSWTL
jgi:hypothetical protein